MFTGLCTVCVSVMDVEFILRVAERRIKAALGRADPGKSLFTLEQLWLTMQ